MRRGLFPLELLRRAQRPLQLLKASGQPMRGGSKEVAGEVWFTGTNHGGARKKKVALATPRILLEADIEEHILLSYEWRDDRSFDIHEKHGLMAHALDREIWLPGIAETFPEEKGETVTRSMEPIPVCS